ncbi:hypothetical protein ACFSGX_06400 [Sphingomonas arantia]|uniref:Uncharacterized protein n=1 Tax=Sphingomonas arantia TaxID=1460676 RepID=A0ABW4TX88_9SPHN
MNRTVKFVLIVVLVSGATSFLLTAITGGARSTTSPAFIGAIFGMSVGFVYLLFSNNRKVVLADDATRRAALAEQTLGPGTARLLVVRESSVGMLVGVDIKVDGTVLTQLKSPRFAVLPVAPGHHDCVAIAQGKRTAVLPIDAEAGTTTVLRITATLVGIKLTREDDTPALRASLARVAMVQPDPSAVPRVVASTT